MQVADKNQFRRVDGSMFAAPPRIPSSRQFITPGPASASQLGQANNLGETGIPPYLHMTRR